jgi:hypothetical protein
MKLARRMVLPGRVSAFYHFLLFRLMFPSNKALSPHPKRMPKYMPDRIASRYFKKWQRMMGNDHPNLLASLPRLMLLGRNKRACSVPSLIQMTMFRHVDFFPRNLKLLRAMFSVCFDSGKSFALEFSAHDNRVLVLKFTVRNGAIFMATELYDRFSGIRRKTEELEVKLVHDWHFIKLLVQMNENETGSATFFYVRSILLPFPVDYDIGDFNIDGYSLVSFWLGNKIPDFARKCDEILNRKRIRDGEPSSEVPSKVPSEADSKRRKITKVDEKCNVIVSLKRVRDCEPSSDSKRRKE